MNPEIAILLGVSCIAAAVGVGATDLVSNRGWRLGISAGFLAAGIGVYTLTAPSGVETKGGGPREVIAVVFCYVSMVLGMAAQYFYRQAEVGARKLRFKPIEFLMPIFASPIVFIPLLTISTDAAMNGPFTQARLMVYLVAFQNGFFWKNFFDEKKPRVLAAPAEAR